MAKTPRKSSTGKATAAREKSNTQQVAEPIRAMASFEDMERLMERYFDRVSPRSWMHRHGWDMPSLADMAMPFEGKHPRVDVIEKDNEIVVKAELPGVEKKDLDVSMTDNTITIKAENSHETEVDKSDYYHHEISKSSFSRTVSLPAKVDGSKATASFNNGIMEMKIPKVEGSRRRKIEVK